MIAGPLLDHSAFLKQKCGGSFSNFYSIYSIYSGVFPSLVISAGRAGELWSVPSLRDTWADGKFAAAHIAVFSNRGKPNHVLSVVVPVKHEVLPAPPV